MLKVSASGVSVCALETIGKTDRYQEVVLPSPSGGESRCDQLMSASLRLGGGCGNELGIVNSLIKPRSSCHFSSIWCPLPWPGLRPWRCSMHATSIDPKAEGGGGGFKGDIHI